MSKGVSQTSVVGLFYACTVREISKQHGPEKRHSIHFNSSLPHSAYKVFYK